MVVVLGVEGVVVRTGLEVGEDVVHIAACRDESYVLLHKGDRIPGALGALASDTGYVLGTG